MENGYPKPKLLHQTCFCYLLANLIQQMWNNYKNSKRLKESWEDWQRGLINIFRKLRWFREVITEPDDGVKLRLQKYKLAEKIATGNNREFPRQFRKGTRQRRRLTYYRLDNMTSDVRNLFWSWQTLNLLSDFNISSGLGPWRYQISDSG